MIEVVKGNSKSDRISFSTRKNSVTAIRNEDETITIEYHSRKKEKNTKEQIKDDFGLYIALFIFFIVPLIIKTFILVPMIRKGICGIWCYLFPAIFWSTFFGCIILNLRFNGEAQTEKNHGAEHMTWRAYNKLKRIPDVYEVKKFSRISPHCGIMQITNIITFQLIGFAIFAYTGIAVFDGILVLLAFYLRHIFPFNILGLLLQFVTTKEPEDENIELALATLKILEKIEKRRK